MKRIVNVDSIISFLSLGLFLNMFLGLFLGMGVTSAKAHTMGISQGHYNIQENKVSVSLVFAVTELNALLDTNSEANTLSDYQPLVRRIVESILIAPEIGRCELGQQDIEFLKNDGFKLDADYTCDDASSTQIVSAGFLDFFPAGHRHLITKASQNGFAETGALYKGNSTFTLAAVPNSDAQELAPAAMFIYGIEHIITGYDHLIFLLGLVLLTRRFKTLLISVSAFTVAHCITLAISVMNIWTPSAAIIEPLIGLSIVYIGIENFYLKKHHWRWAVTFLFGLIHGFGFAGALSEISISTDQIVAVLLGFNAGVEFGQLALIAVCIPCLAFLRRYRWFQVAGNPVINTGIVVLGLYWFIERIAITPFSDII